MIDLVAVILNAMTFVVLLITLVVYIVEVLLKRK